MQAIVINYNLHILERYTLDIIQMKSRFKRKQTSAGYFELNEKFIFRL